MPCLDRPTFGHTGSGHSQRLTHHSQTINSLYKARATFLHEEVARLRRLGRHRLFYIFAVQPTRRVGVRPKCAWPGNRILYSESRLRLLCLWVTNPLPLGNLLEHQPGTTTWQTSSEIRSPAAGGRLSGPVEYCLAWTPPWGCRYKIEPTPGPN